MHDPLKNRNYLRKKLIFNFFGANSFVPKSGHRHEKQPVLGSDCVVKFLDILSLLSFYTVFIVNFEQVNTN